MREAYFFVCFWLISRKKMLEMAIPLWVEWGFRAVESVAKSVEKKIGEIGCNSKFAWLQCGCKGRVAMCFWLPIGVKLP